jgi:hypothetical protein
MSRLSGAGLARNITRTQVLDRHALLKAAANAGPGSHRDGGNGSFKQG